VKSYVARIEECKGEIERKHMAYMGEIKEIRSDIADIFTEAKDNGLPRKALKLVIKTREKQAELEAIREDLEGDELDQYDLLRHALGDLADTDIGQAALERQAEKQANASGAVDDLAERFPARSDALT
jgi:uncharacterized protein (UPF0335 family)